MSMQMWLPKGGRTLQARKSSTRGRVVQFGVLGPLSFKCDGAPLPINGPMLRRILALLLAYPNQPIAVDHLTTALWSDDPPPGARKALQVYVHRLRHALGDDERISYEPNGYSLAISEDELDSKLFAELAAKARSERGAGHNEKAAALMQAALDLWRGPAFEGLAEHQLIIDEARRLDEERLRATAEHIEIKLDLGRHLELIPRLSQLSENHPYREDLQGHLMTALYRSGRQTEALEVFHRARKQLDEELGVEPGPALRELHLAILRGAPELDLNQQDPQPITIPRELPPAVLGFVGRTQQLDQLGRMIRHDGTEMAMPIALVTGSGGVGKTATVLHWAHRVVDSFPDGQLFVDLRGYSGGTPTRPIDALTSLLRSLGVPAQQIPVDQIEAATMYRSRLSGRRMLVVLDNAHSAADVRPLLPGTSGCYVVVTSRDRLSGLVAQNGATRVSLDVLSPDEAYELVAHLLGSAVERRSIAELADACAHLPLALRIAIAYLLDRPHQTIAQLLTRLREGDRLQVLAIEGDETTAVRAAFDLSYTAVEQEAQLLFRRLGLVPCHDFTPESTAALTGLPQATAELILERLADAHLVSATGIGRYSLHDLLRVYARERCDLEDSATDQARSVKNLLDHFYSSARAAGRILNPAAVRLRPPYDLPARDFADMALALRWLDEEHANVVSAIRHAAEFGPRHMAWLMTDQLRAYLSLRGHTTLLFTSARAGLSAARTTNNLLAQAAMFHALGMAYGTTGQYPAATKNLERGLALCEDCEWLEGQALALSNLGVVKGLLGESPSAVPMFMRALDIALRLGDSQRESAYLHNLANAHWRLGNLHEALAHCDRAVVKRSTSNTTYHAAMATLGKIQQLLGQLANGRFTLLDALVGLRKIGDSQNDAHASSYLSAVLVDLGRSEEAYAEAAYAVRVARDVGYPPALVAGLTALGGYHVSIGDTAAAFGILQEAVEIGTRMGINFELTGALITNARAHLRADDPHSAQTIAKHALDLSLHGEFQVCQGQALVTLALTVLSSGDPPGAVDLARKALEIQRATGHRLGEADALRILALAEADPAAASKHAEAAQTIYAETGAIPPRDLPFAGSAHFDQ